MFQKRSPRFRPTISDFLEDRAVPSAGGSIAPVSAAAASTGTGTLSQLTTELTQAGTQINAAYAAFASAVRQTESEFVNNSPPGTPTTDIATLDIYSSTNIGSLIKTLSTAVTSALGSIPGASADAGVIAGAFTGSGPGSLNSQMSTLINTEAPIGRFNQSTLPLLFSAVESAISASYSATASEVYVSAVKRSGLANTTSSTTTSPINPTTLGAAVNSAYSTFALAVRTAELTIPATPVPSGPISISLPIGFTPNPSTKAVASVNAAIGTLSQSLSATLAATPAASYSGLLQGELTGSNAGSLASQMSTLLLATAAEDGSEPSANLPLLYAAVDSAINASYESIAIQGYLLASA